MTPPRRLLLATAATFLLACSGGTQQTPLDGGVDDASTADATTTTTQDLTTPTSDLASADLTTTKGDMATSNAFPVGWLYTKGSKIYVSDGGAGKPWMGRGVNIDDIFLCGYNNTLWMSGADQTLNTIIANVVTDWKPNFFRLSLSLDSYDTVSWLTNASQYKMPMTGVINTIGTHPGVYVLVVLRSDASMIGHFQADPEPTGIPSDSVTSPNKTAFPTGTDAVYKALVNSFANAPYVLFGLTNEPGGNSQSNAKISAAMSHAVAVIRAEEDLLGVPHHIISVQGNDWTSSIGFYASAPIAADNIVYEVHGYPPPTSSYTYANLPVIIGEYGPDLGSGSLAFAPAFYADLESKQISNLAWDLEPYSNCSPDLVTVTHTTTLTPTAWGNVVKSYLLAH